MKKVALLLIATLVVGTLFSEVSSPAHACGGAVLDGIEIGEQKATIYATPSWANIGGRLQHDSRSISFLHTDLLKVLSNNELSRRNLAVIVDEHGTLFAGRVAGDGAVIVRVIRLENGAVKYEPLGSVEFHSDLRGCSPVTSDSSAW